MTTKRKRVAMDSVYVLVVYYYYDDLGSGAGEEGRFRRSGRQIVGGRVGLFFDVLLILVLVFSI